ncbi:hypothetical protein EON79_09160 [bacterium]|nr:MAG: hypothetical protein EON79_09160 [bacterium]
MAMIENGRRWAQRQGKPLSLGIVVGLIVTSLVTFFVPSVYRALYFNAGDMGERPWSFLTYPLAYTGVGGPFTILFFIFLLFWVLFAGGFLEKDAGIGKAAAFWVVMTVLPAIVMGIGGRLLGTGVPLAGPYLPVAAVTVYWGIRNKEFPILLWGILPLKGLYIAILDVVGTFFMFGAGGGAAPILGLLACIHLGIAWLLAERAMIRIPDVPKKTKAQLEREEKFEDEVLRRKKERDEVERLRRLLEGPTGGEDR